MTYNEREKIGSWWRQMGGLKRFSSRICCTVFEQILWFTSLRRSGFQVVPNLKSADCLGVCNEKEASV